MIELFIHKEGKKDHAGSKLIYNVHMLFYDISLFDFFVVIDLLTKVVIQLANQN